MIDRVWLLCTTGKTSPALIHRIKETSSCDIGAKLYDAIDPLAEFPTSARPGRAPGTRELVTVHTPLLVVCRIHVQTNEVQIIRILHAKQEYHPE